jgi:hypothetical protein
MNKMALLILLIIATPIFGQIEDRGFFVGYETLEMAMNEFTNFAGEVGYRLDEKSRVRLTIMEVSLTERHLSSSWEAAAVDGSDVEGYFRGYEMHYDRFFKRRFYVSANIGYYNDLYEHTKLDEEVENTSVTLGSGLGFQQSQLFGVDHLYLNFSIPVRFYFSKLEETKLGDTKIREHIVVNNRVVAV